MALRRRDCAEAPIDKWGMRNRQTDTSVSLHEEKTEWCPHSVLKKVETSFLLRSSFQSMNYFQVCVFYISLSPSLSLQIHLWAHCNKNNKWTQTDICELIIFSLLFRSWFNILITSKCWFLVQLIVVGIVYSFPVSIIDEWASFWFKWLQYLQPSYNSSNIKCVAFEVSHSRHALCLIMQHRLDFIHRHTRLVSSLLH